MLSFHHPNNREKGIKRHSPSRAVVCSTKRILKLLSETSKRYMQCCSHTHKGVAKGKKITNSIGVFLGRKLLWNSPLATCCVRARFGTKVRDSTDLPCFQDVSSLADTLFSSFVSSPAAKRMISWYLKHRQFVFCYSMMLPNSRWRTWLV